MNAEGDGLDRLLGEDKVRLMGSLGCDAFLNKGVHILLVPVDGNWRDWLYHILSVLSIKR